MTVEQLIELLKEVNPNKTLTIVNDPKSGSYLCTNEPNNKIIIIASI